MSAAHFDAIVVGSGFGGSVTTYRLAKAGMKVCLLERGRAYPPNSFPRTQQGMRRNFWDPSEGYYGMFNIWSFRGIEAIVSSGLGGGSLIYANVLLRKPREWFVQHQLYNGSTEHWPVSYEDLEPHYERVEKMMNVQRYPLHTAPYSGTRKTRALQEAAEELGLHWELPNLAVTFGNPGEEPVPGEPIRETRPNLHNRTRYTCRLCGECDVGCNYGSKNTLDYNYLTEAMYLGADIRTLSEVRSFRPLEGGGYAVRYRLLDESRTTKAEPNPEVELTADRLILSAGTLGTNYLLLRNRAAFPRLSPKLGAGFCGNGDLLTFAVRCQEEVDGKLRPRAVDPTYGPVITSTVKVEDAASGGEGRGFYIQDAGFPAFVTWLLEATQLKSTVRRFGRALVRRIRSWVRRDPRTDLSAEVGAILGECEFSSGSLPLLGMGRDVPDGQMSLNGKYLELDWTVRTSRDYFSRVRSVMRDIARAWGARFVDNPTYRLSRVITVHPVGGCAMAASADEGVVDPYGEVFNYPGLYVADGSVMPGPVGPNPALTIAALADRTADRILQKRAEAAASGAASRADAPRAAGLS